MDSYELFIESLVDDILETKSPRKLYKKTMAIVGQKLNVPGSMLAPIFDRGANTDIFGDMKHIVAPNASAGQPEIGGVDAKQGKLKLIDYVNIDNPNMWRPHGSPSVPLPPKNDLWYAVNHRTSSNPRQMAKFILQSLRGR